MFFPPVEMDVYQPLSTLSALRRCAHAMGMDVLPLAAENKRSLTIINEDGTRYEMEGSTAIPSDRARTIIMWMYMDWSEDQHLFLDFTQFD